MNAYKQLTWEAKGLPPTQLDSSEREALRSYLSEQMKQPARRKASGGGCLHNIVGIIGILILGIAFSAGFDYVLAPWSWSILGRPTLTGEWVGSFRLPEGQRGVAYLNLTHNPNPDYDVRDSYSIHNLPPFNGNALGCIGNGGVQNYSLYGGATSSGQDVEMTLQAQKPTIPNFALHELKGAWDGVNLTLVGTVTTILDTQDSTLVKSEPNQTQPTTIILHKGGRADFVRACQALGSSS